MYTIFTNASGKLFAVPYWTEFPFTKKLYKGVVPPLLLLAVKVTVPPVQIVVAVDESEIEGITFELICIVTGLLLLFDDVWQTLFVVIIHETTLPFEKLLLLNVLLLEFWTDIPSIIKL